MREWLKREVEHAKQETIAGLKSGRLANPPPVQPAAGPDTVVKTYRGSAAQIQQAFAADVIRAHAEGYEVVSQSAIPGHRGGCVGCLGIATLGLLFLLVRPSDTLIVTYRKVR